MGDESAGSCDTHDEFVPVEDHLSNATEMSDSRPSFRLFRLEFARPLVNTSTLSVGDTLVLIIDFAIKHGLAWTAIEDLLKLCNKILSTAVLLDTKYLFRKFSATSPEEMRFYFYCPICNHLLAKAAGTLSEHNCVSKSAALAGS